MIAGAGAAASPGNKTSCEVAICWQRQYLGRNLLLSSFKQCVMKGKCDEGQM